MCTEERPSFARLQGSSKVASFLVERKAGSQGATPRENLRDETGLDSKPRRRVSRTKSRSDPLLSLSFSHTTSRSTMSFARSAARLLRSVPTAAAPASHLPFRPPTASTSRLLSSFRPTPLRFASTKAGSAGIAAFLPKRFPSGSGASAGSRGVATTVVKRADEVDWTKIGTSVGVAVVAVVGLNYALNRETRGALTAAESS